MATTTTNFGWDIPQSTDLVKDGATAIATLGQDIDTSLVDLKGGTTGQALTKTSNTDMDFTWTTISADITAVNVTSPITGGGSSGDVTIGIQDGTTAQKGAVQLTDSTASTSTTTAATPNSVKTSYDLANGAIPKSTVTTNGDLIYGTGSSAVTRLGIGSTGQVLQVSGGVPVWASAPSTLASYSLISSSALSGSQTVTISGLSSYNSFLVVVSRASSTNSASTMCVRINGDTASNYIWHGNKPTKGSGTEYDYSGSGGTSGTTEIRLGTIGAATDEGGGAVHIFGGKSSTLKPFVVTGGGGGTNSTSYNVGGYYNTTSAISSISVYSTTGNLDAGNVYVYGSAV